jgi:hypothetical protein
MSGQGRGRARRRRRIVMDMRICITQGAAHRPVTVEAFGLSLSLSGLPGGCPVVIADGEGGLTVSIGAGKQWNGAPGTDTDGQDVAGAAGVQGEQPSACTEAEAEAEAEAETVPPGPDGEDDLFQKLSALRKKVSVEVGVPPYCVFHDNTLKEMCAGLPADLAAMSGIGGVGKAKLEKYGAVFIAAIRDHTGATA